MSGGKPNGAPAAAADGAPPPLTPEALLADFSPAVRALARRVIALVQAHVPDLELRAYPGWRGIGLRDAQAGYFCGVFPRHELTERGGGRTECVRVLFEHGAALPDPERVLAEGGAQARWATLRPGEPIPEAALLQLVDAALLHGATRARGARARGAGGR